MPATQLLPSSGRGARDLIFVGLIPGLHLYALNKLEAVQYLAPLLPHSSKDIPTPCTA